MPRMKCLAACHPGLACMGEAASLEWKQFTISSLLLWEYFCWNHGLWALQKLQSYHIRSDAASIKSFFWFSYPIEQALRSCRNIRIGILNKNLCYLVQVTSVTHFRGWGNNVSPGSCDRICTKSFIPASCSVSQGLSGAHGELKLERFLDPSRYTQIY